MVRKEDIKPTSKGFRVDKKVAGLPRLRKTFQTYDEARHALAKYLRGEGGDLPVIAPSVTWRTVFDNCVRAVWRHNKSKTQMENAERVVEQFLGWDNDVRAFDRAAARQLSDDLEASGRSLVTVGKYLSAVRCMLNQAKEDDLITWKLPKIDHYKQTETRINFFDYDEEQRIVNIMHQIGRSDMADLFIVLIETGMRTAEGMYLQWRDVALQDNIIRIWGDGTKTGKSRRVPITQRCKEALMRAKADAEPYQARVFPRATKSFLRSTWESVRKATGNDDKDFVWYTTRHTCASRLMRAGVDVKTIQTWLGHSRIETTMRYIQFSNGSLIAAASALDGARKAVTEVDTADTRLT